MHYLLGSIVKQAEIFNKNVFYNFPRLFWGQNLIFGAYHREIGKVKKIGNE